MGALTLSRASVRVSVDIMAQDTTCGYLSILVANLGYRSSMEGQSAIHRTFQDSSAGIFTVQEGNDDPSPEQWMRNKHVHFVRADRLGEATVGVGIRDSLGTIVGHEDFTVVGGRFMGADCVNCFLVARLQLRRPFQGRDTLNVASIHLHRGVAKRAKGCRLAADAFWDAVAYNVVTYDPLVLTGEFNMVANKVAEEITRATGPAAGRLQYAIDTTALVFPDTWDGESECLAVYWSSAVGHARPHAKAPFLSGWDPTRQLWGHGGHWPLHTILAAPGAKRIRTKEGQEKQKQRKLRCRDENRQKKWQNWGRASQLQTEEWSGWSQEDWSGRDWRGQEADEEQWHGAEEGDFDDDEESRGDWHSDRRVSLRARNSVARGVRRGRREFH